MQNKRKKLILSVVAFFVVCFIFTFGQVFAADVDEGLSSDRVVISGTHQITNNTDLNNVSVTFVLAAKNANNPMPAGSKNGVKEISVKVNSPFAFNAINFPEAGTYEYVLSRKVVPSDTLKQDSGVYNINVAVFRDGTAAMVIKKEGVEGKLDKIEYNDTHQEKQKRTLTFDLNGGTLDGKTGVLELEYVEGQEIIIPDGPEKSGYKFLYWHGSKYYPGDKYVVEGDHKFTATYRAKAETTTTSDDSDDNGNRSSRSNGSNSGNSSSGKSNFQTGDFLPYAFGGALLFSLFFIGVVSRRRK